MDDSSFRTRFTTLSQAVIDDGPRLEEAGVNALQHAPRMTRRFWLLMGVTLALIVGIVTALTPRAEAATTYCSSSSGGSGGSYYQMWTAGQGSACMTMNSNTSYSTQWSNIGDQVSGVGWKPGSSSQAINYSGSLNANGGTALLTLYGWSQNPLIEYYVIESYRGSPPTQGQNMGTFYSDGSNYTIIKHQQVNQPSIVGTTTFWQYIAIRQNQRTSGTITFPNFVNAWASKGMNLGSMDYQIMATESWGGGSGSSNVSLSRGTPSSTNNPPPSSSTGNPGGGGGGCTATLSAGTKGSNWYNLNVAVSGSSNWTVTLNLVSPAVVSSTWNTSATWPSQYQMVAKPNGSGNNFGLTISTNGQWTWPSVSCSSA